MFFKPPGGEKLIARMSRFYRQNTAIVKKSRFVRAKEGIEHLMEDMKERIKEADDRIRKNNTPKSYTGL